MELTAAAPVALEVEGGLATLRLAAPERRNALDGPVLALLLDALRSAAADPAVRALVIDAEGPDFCAGMELGAAFGEGGAGPARAAVEAYAACLLEVRRSPRPVVAAVRGEATGGGVGLAAACDLVIAAPEARFSLPEVVLGVIPAVVTPFLLRRLPPGRAGALALGSRTLDAAEAHAAGLVDEVAADGVDAALDRQLRRLFRSSPDALAAQKRHLDALSGGAALEAQAAASVERLLEVLADPEALEGARAFADGFAPAWFSRPPRRAP